MGKTELISKLSSRMAVDVVSAATLIWSKLPVSDDKLVLIDGLDELAERREGDALGKVLERLAEADWPNFILSCRAADWDLRGESDIKRSPLGKAVVYTLEPFSKEETKTFLHLKYPNINADDVIDHLSRHDLDDLMGNPLTLDLLGRVASQDVGLPETKGQLFAKAVEVLALEENDEYGDSPLKQTSGHVLDAAGAMCAGYILTGAASITRKGPASSTTGVLAVSEIKDLPKAEFSSEALKSRIFRPIDGAEAFAPIHKVIAEYLGAQWLAKQAADPISCRRLLGLLTSRGVVPANLRGIHAWLAFHSDRLAEQVIKTDPYGVLRYGDADDLTARAALFLFDALQNLAEDNPYFRAGDWQEHSVRGLMRPELFDDIREILLSREKPFHLRSLFWDGLKTSPLANHLFNDLKTIVLSLDYYYAERNDAAEALWGQLTDQEQTGLINDLRCLGDDDSTRLAVELLDNAKFSAVGVRLFVDTLLADAGLTVCPIDKEKINEGLRVRGFDLAARIVPDCEVPALLDYLSPMVEFLAMPGHHDGQQDVIRLVLSLFHRALILGEDNPSRLWKWLRCLIDTDRGDKEIAKAIRESLNASPELRRNLLYHIAFVAEAKRFSSDLVFYGSDTLFFLFPSQEELGWLIQEMASMDNTDKRTRDTWCSFISRSGSGEALAKSLRPSAKQFAGIDVDLSQFLKNAIRPKTPDWKKEHKKRERDRERRQLKKFGKIRASYAGKILEIESGAPYLLYDSANEYLGRFSDLKQEDGPIGRLERVYGDDLSKSILKGFEASLLRNDLPSARDVSASIAEGRQYCCVPPILAALLERKRNGRTIADVPNPAMQVALRSAQESWLHGEEFREDDLRDQLETLLLTSDKEKEAFLRDWIEPGLEKGLQHVSGLYRLKTKVDWFHVSVPLAAEWLASIPAASLEAQVELIELLLNAGCLDDLAAVAESKAMQIHPDIEYLLTWLAVEFYTRFPEIKDQISGIGKDIPDFIWRTRNFVRADDQSKQLLLTPEQAYFIVAEFRSIWPKVERSPGARYGDQHDSDATQFIRSVLESLSRQTTDTALQFMDRLVSAPRDTYTDAIKAARSYQLQQSGEASFEQLNIKTIKAVVLGAAPQTMNDLHRTVLDIFEELQAWLSGHETTPIKNFWPNAIPRGENDTRDLVADYLRSYCEPLGIEVITEKRMLKDKRADMIFKCGALQLPVEAKGQWHKDIWDAASNQLGRLYMADPRGYGQGVYLVFWYGLKAPAERAVRSHPCGLDKPSTAVNMKELIYERISPRSKNNVSVVVLDLGM